MARTSKTASRKAMTRPRKSGLDRSAKVPGPSPDPSSNLVLADVAIWMGSYMVRRMVERSFLSGRYGKQTAKAIVQNRSIRQKVTTMVIARLGTSGLPGAALVTTGMATKVLLDRSKARRLAQAEGDQELLDQARGD